MKSLFSTSQFALLAAATLLVSLPGHAKSDCCFSDVEAFEYLNSISKFSESITSIQQVEEINLIGKCVNDDIFRAICRATNLTSLTLANDNCPGDKKLTGSGLSLLAHTPKITSLDLDHNLIDGTHLKSLNQLPHLRFLKLEHNPFTAQDWLHLAKVRVQGTLVLTNNGVENLKNSPLAHFLDHTQARSLLLGGISPEFRIQLEADLLKTKGNAILKTLHFPGSLNVNLVAHLIETYELSELRIGTIDGSLESSRMAFTEERLQSLDFKFDIASAQLLRQFAANTDISSYSFSGLSFDASLADAISGSGIQQARFSSSMDINLLIEMISKSPKTRFYFELLAVIDKSKSPIRERTSKELNTRIVAMGELLLKVCRPDQCFNTSMMTSFEEPLEDAVADYRAQIQTFSNTSL